MQFGQDKCEVMLCGEVGAVHKENHGLRHEVTHLRMSYDKASGKATTLRDGLRSAKRCLEQRNKQLAVSHRMVDRLSIDRDKLEACFPHVLQLVTS
jgi:hypothetical protein